MDLTMFRAVPLLATYRRRRNFGGKDVLLRQRLCSAEVGRAVRVGGE